MIRHCRARRWRQSAMRLAIAVAIAAWTGLVVAGWRAGDAVAGASAVLFLMCVAACVVASRAERRAMTELEEALEALAACAPSASDVGVQQDWLPAELRTLVGSTGAVHARTINDTMSFVAADSRPAVNVLVVTGAACHLCDDALTVLEDLRSDFPLEIRAVEAASSEGREIVGARRPPLLPLVLVDDEVFSFGRLPRKKLRKFLERRR